jgi:hypothetical protein
MNSFEDREQDDKEHQWNMHMLSGTLDDQHVIAPPNTFHHFLLWAHNSEKKREEAGGSSTGGDGAGGAIILAPFVLIFVVIGILPISLFWHYHKKNWFYFTLTVVLFIASGGYFLSKTHGDVWNALLGIEMVFGFAYLPLAALGWVCHRLNDRIAKGAPFNLTAWSWVVLIALAIALEIHFFLWTKGLGWGASLVRFIGGSMTYLFDAPYLYLSDYNDYATMLIAAFPMVTAVMTLQAWFRKRKESGKRAVPWLFYLPMAWVVGLALFLGVILTTNYLERKSQAAPVTHQSQIVRRPTKAH